MRAPSFWQKRGFITELLVPLSALYFVVIRLRSWCQRLPKKVSVPVVCLGNIVAGGSGKTPACLALGAHYIAAGTNIAFLSRGYKGTINRATKVDVTKHSATEVGDEPLLLAQVAPTYVGANRYQSALLAIADGAELLIMDDGLQHRSLQQDCRILVIDGATGFGNELLMPAGPLRDKISSVADVDMLLIIGDDVENSASYFPETPVFTAQFTPDDASKDPSKPYYLPFAGIGRPDKFFDTLEQHGYSFDAVVRLPDHHRYRHKDIAYLRELSAKHNAQLITTGKDMVKLPADFGAEIEQFHIRLTLSNPTALCAQIDQVCR